MASRKPLMATVHETEAAFYAAMQKADIDGMMALWAEDDEIACTHPGAPRLVGHAAIRAAWESIFERGGVQVTPLQLHTTHNPMTAVHTLIEAITPAGSIDTHIVATNVYVRTALGWRMLVHHASVAPGKAPSGLGGASILH